MYRSVTAALAALLCASPLAAQPDVSGPEEPEATPAPSAEEEDVNVEVAEDSAPEDPRDGADAELDAAEDYAEGGYDDELPADEFEPPPELPPQEIQIEGKDLSKLSGSGHSMGKKELERFEHDDAHSVLLRVPGVYVRGEDGYGLRPNIGFRGANSDRSKKLTLMEDGVLFGPAPYSAPAAYYFPLMTRMVGVDVYKGPSAIRYGPNTIGGAIDLRTRPIIDDGGEVDVAYGSYNYGKVHGHYSLMNDRMGLLVEGAHVRSDGFKSLPGDGSTGFRKNEFMAKWMVMGDFDAPVYQELEVKVGYADEVSNETYLGLTDDDFQRNALRRYAGSQRDQMVYSRTQLAVTHRLDLSREQKLVTTIYRNDFERAWTKLNRFGERGTDSFGNPSASTTGDLSAVLAAPTGRRQIFYDVLRGAEDSATSQETLMIGTNDRKYVSQGIQLLGTWESGGNSWFKHRLEYGLRYHYDEIERFHTEEGFLMVGGRLRSDNGPTIITTKNRGESRAVAMHVLDDLTFGNLMVSPGVRAELIHTQFSDSTPATTNGVAVAGGDLATVFVPGVGAFYAIVPTFGVLAGVHRGFSPVPPGRHLVTEGANPKPERSVNYEAGARWAERRSSAEVIGFYNDYQNLTAQCAFSGGCPENQLDEQIDAGSARIYGVEVSAAHAFKLDQESALQIPGRLAYTFTQTELLDTFESADPQLGDVEDGDELAYVPEHQLSLTAGVENRTFGAHASFTYVSEMRETASQGKIEDGEGTDPYAILDLAGAYNVTKRGQVYLRVDNVFDNRYITSRRPFGARPGRPRIFQVGFKYRL